MQGHSKRVVAQSKASTPAWSHQDLRILHDIQTYLAHDAIRQKYGNRDCLLKVLCRLFLPSYSVEAIKQRLTQFSSDTLSPLPAQTSAAHCAASSTCSLPIAIAASEPDKQDARALRSCQSQCGPRMARNRLRSRPYNAQHSAETRKRALDAALGLDQRPSTLPNDGKE